MMSSHSNYTTNYWRRPWIVLYDWMYDRETINILGISILWLLGDVRFSNSHPTIIEGQSHHVGLDLITHSEWVEGSFGIFIVKREKMDKVNPKKEKKKKLRW